ncbi:hypothetical protein, conserved [Babesia bigemina]|uniref:Uncharacterized protein n=1 Tax=Babesia bigemina TaxID=5866 RepID=A0A061DEZ1_BABBI|nr:hypothetical protein, conserved [Babesia bigemina]CDR98120.1 hypothetical protein, conserved [Babesia bigemina]|eukprot:XP_012770306.1 hypothetical protein, conserved [Babesia bigemina]
MYRFENLRDESCAVESAEICSFPAYRSVEWLENHRLMPAPHGCLDHLTINPQSLSNYAHIRAYEVKANAVRTEIRNALFRQALFKIQNIEVLADNKCKKDRILRQIIKKAQPWFACSILKNKSIISEDIWQIDRCGSVQNYSVSIREVCGYIASGAILPRRGGRISLQSVSDESKKFIQPFEILLVNVKIPHDSKKTCLSLDPS